MTRHEYELWGAKATCLHGERLPHTVLNESVVREIRINREGLTAKERARRLGVHYRTVEKVLYRETWGHVQ